MTATRKVGVLRAPCHKDLSCSQDDHDRVSYIDLNKVRANKAVMLVQTIRKSYEGYTREEMERAILARKTQPGEGT
jgi:hypothetical protein